MKHWAAGVGGESARVTMHTRAAGSAWSSGTMRKGRQLMLEQVAHEDAQRVAFGDQGQPTAMDWQGITSRGGGRPWAA